MILIVLLYIRFLHHVFVKKVNPSYFHVHKFKLHKYYSETDNCRSFWVWNKYCWILNYSLC